MVGRIVWECIFIVEGVIGRPSFFVLKIDGRVRERAFEEDIPVMFRLEAIEYFDGFDGREVKRSEFFEFAAESPGHIDRMRSGDTGLRVKLFETKVFDERGIREAVRIFGEDAVDVGSETNSFG